MLIASVRPTIIPPLPTDPLPAPYTRSGTQRCFAASFPPAAPAPILPCHPHHPPAAGGDLKMTLLGNHARADGPLGSALERLRMKHHQSGAPWDSRFSVLRSRFFIA